MVHIFEDGTKLPWDYPTFINQGLRFASKIVFNCLAYVALTVRSIQLVLGSISEELTEDWRNLVPNNTTDCRNICPEKLEKDEIDQCLDRSLSLPYQGRIFLRKWLTHMTMCDCYFRKCPNSFTQKLPDWKKFCSEWKNSENSKTLQSGDYYISLAHHSKSESGKA